MKPPAVRFAAVATSTFLADMLRASDEDEPLRRFEEVAMWAFRGFVLDPVGRHLDCGKSAATGNWLTVWPFPLDRCSVDAAVVVVAAGANDAVLTVVRRRLRRIDVAIVVGILGKMAKRIAAAAILNDHRPCRRRATLRDVRRDYSIDATVGGEVMRVLRCHLRNDRMLARQCLIDVGFVSKNCML